MENNIESKKKYINENYSHIEKNKDLTSSERQEAMMNMSNEAKLLYEMFVQEVSNQFLDGYYDGLKSSQPPEFYEGLVSSTLPEEIFYVGCQTGAYENKKPYEKGIQKVKK